MRVHTKVEYEWVEDGEDVYLRVVNEEGFDYEGPVELAGGGPSAAQTAAAASQANLANQQAQTGQQMLNFWKQGYNTIAPMATQRLQNGLPFFNSLTDYTGGTNAAAYAPAQAGLRRQLSSYGSLPSGFKQQALTDFDAQRARGFDQGMSQDLFANDAAKTGAASLLTNQQQLASPQSWFGGATQANQSIMQAPLATPGIGSALAGAAGGIGSALINKIPF